MGRVMPLDFVDILEENGVALVAAVSIVLVAASGEALEVEVR